MTIVEDPMRKAIFLFTTLAMLQACATTTGGAGSAQTPPSAMQGKNPLGSGYLGGGALPDSLLLSPPPPAAGSVTEARDREGAAAAVAMQGSARWDFAKADADLRPGHAATAFSCAAGFLIDQAHAPALTRLLTRAMGDLGMSTADVKKRYMRPRPFMDNGKPSCTPDWEKFLRRDGSYPSGHSAIGYGYGLILAEVMPDRAARLVARGRAFGDSRRICNVHWLSDIEEGRVIASATVMRLNAEPAFAADLAAARKEVAALRGKPWETAPDCAQEAAALAQ
ncbi:acid phosphatase [Sphingobium chungangianum]